MKSILTRSGAVALACTAALTATAAIAAQKAPAEEPETAPAEAPAGDKVDAAGAAETKTEDGRICRYIKLDMSSRRKSKICRTTEEWRDLGNPR